MNKLILGKNLYVEKLILGFFIFGIYTHIRVKITPSESNMKNMDFCNHLKILLILLYSYLQ
jgi:hypothetical protein